jgi:hypothetical protein
MDSKGVDYFIDARGLSAEQLFHKIGEEIPLDQFNSVELPLVRNIFTRNNPILVLKGEGQEAVVQVKNYPLCARGKGDRKNILLSMFYARDEIGKIIAENPL